MQRRTKRQQGATMVEYAIMVASIAVAVAVIVALVGINLNDKYVEVRDCVMGIANGQGADACPKSEQQ